MYDRMYNTDKSLESIRFLCDVYHFNCLVLIGFTLRYRRVMTANWKAAGGKFDS
jgi:hypothetical protein